MPLHQHFLVSHIKARQGRGGLGQAPCHTRASETQHVDSLIHPFLGRGQPLGLQRSQPQSSQEREDRTPLGTPSEVEGTTLLPPTRGEQWVTHSPCGLTAAMGLPVASSYPASSLSTPNTMWSIPVSAQFPQGSSYTCYVLSIHGQCFGPPASVFPHTLAVQSMLLILSNAPPGTGTSASSVS